MTLPQQPVQVAQLLRSSMPSTCRWLSSEDIKPIGRFPIAAGGFADVWEATHNGRKVILKSYRCYATFDIAQIAKVVPTFREMNATDVLQRFQTEVHVCDFLHHRAVAVVPFVGVYSTEEHPFGLIYEYMDGLDLKQYLRNEPNARKLKLVLNPLYTLPTL